MYIHVSSRMLHAGETEYEARERIRAVQLLRAERRAPVDKLAERDRLTRYWKAAYPQWQPDLCRICPSFALVHVDSFRPGTLHGHLSLLPGHIPPRKKLPYGQSHRADCSVTPQLSLCFGEVSA